MTTSSLRSRRIAVPNASAAIQDYYEAQGWTDGLPVVPATEDLVWEMLGTFGRDPAQSLGVIQPRNASVTLEKIAINAVMAGCRPEHFPVVVAAVRAILQPAFNVAGCQATTGGAAPVIIVNGPLATQLSINGDAGCFGPGYRANAAIGRALRLVIRNLAGLIPGEMDKATLATPGRYTFCFAENEARSPWEPRHVELGFAASASIVTLTAVRAVYPMMETTVATGREVLQTLVESIKTVGLRQLLSDRHGRAAHPGALSGARRRDGRCRPHESRRAGVHLSGGAHAHAPAQRHCALRQSQLAGLD